MASTRPVCALRTAFGDRLHAALHAAGHPPSAELVHAEMRRRGGGVTIFAVRKWLAGEAIPTQGSVRLLAEWLDVAPSALRFGDQGRQGEPAGDRTLLAALRRLGEDDLQLVADLVLLLMQSKEER